MEKAELAVTTFLDGFLCSQAILSAYGPDGGLDRDLALKVAAGFGGGIGRMGQICGALTGSIMVIGLKKGAASPQDMASRQSTYNAVRELVNRFKDKNKSTMCRELLTCDISIPEEYPRAKELKLFQTLCPGYVKSAAEILDDVLDENP